MEQNLYIHKPKKLDKFGMVNIDNQNSKELTYKEKGLFDHIIVQPPGWNLNLQNLVNTSGDGKESVQSGLKSLIEKNYIYKIVKKTEKGQIKQWGWYVPFYKETPEEAEEYLRINLPEWMLFSSKKSTKPRIWQTQNLANPESGKAGGGIILRRKILRKTNIDIETKVSMNEPDKIRTLIKTKAEETKTKIIQEKKEKTLSSFEKLKSNKEFYVLFEKWYSKVLPSTNKKNQHYSELKHFTNAIKLIRKAVRGTLFIDLAKDDSLFEGHNMIEEKISLSDINDCIDLHIKALSSEYEPTEKKFLKIHLDQFIYNPYIKGGCKSYLIYWILHDPKPNIPLNEIKNEELYNSMIEFLNWEKKKNKDKNKLIHFLNKHNIYLSGLKPNPMYYQDKHCISKAIVDGINNSFLNKDDNFVISPGLFVNDKLLNWIEESINNSKWIK